MILPNGQITANNRPEFAWHNTEKHTNTRNNARMWKVDRPVPLNYEIPMDWHHMIPWKVLRNGWSALATSGRWDALQAWIDTWGLTNVPTIVASMRQESLAAPQNAAMFDKLCWAQWNLVEGPTNGNRAPGDDPGADGLDAFEGRNMPNNLRARSLILKAIYTQMRDWRIDKADVTEADAVALKNGFKNLLPYKQTPIPRFDPSIWALATQGRIDQYGVAELKKHPKWKKVA